MPTIERRYLPPLNPDTTITEADRDRVYNIVQRQLTTILEGDESYYPDGVQKRLQERASYLRRLIDSIASLQGRVNDPANILGDVVGHLEAHADTFDQRIESADPTLSRFLPVNSRQPAIGTNYMSIQIRSRRQCNRFRIRDTSGRFLRRQAPKDRTSQNGGSRLRYSSPFEGAPLGCNRLGSTTGH